MSLQKLEYSLRFNIFLKEILLFETFSNCVKICLVSWNVKVAPILLNGCPLLKFKMWFFLCECVYLISFWKESFPKCMWKRGKNSGKESGGW